MKKKDNISNYIKEDLEKRELNPSRDAWDRIQARMDVAPPVQKSNFKWWLSVAVVAMFMVSASVYVFINHEKETEIITDFVKNTDQKKIDSVKHNTEIISDPTEHILANNEKVDSSKEIEEVAPKEEKQVVQKGKVQVAVNKETQQIELSLPKKTNSVTEKKEAVVEDLAPKRTLVANSGSDSIKNNKKKKNFVDPNMLLYSIENKENLKESNQSRVVSVGFK
ncbi:hypothetical protein [Empedobacter sedimenti]|uniref:hypothetical protein n=1 Tax=Empedobacter sedimenti TaxID=3042610 RepID=UPI0024A6134B|nr:hypothetical protein [Empedobacter sedimenti]